MNHYDFAVIGGGAAGMAAAIACKQENPHLRVAVVERLDRVGKKLLSTGNGRCNLLNADLGKQHYHGTGVPLLSTVFEQVPLDALLRFFDSLGLPVVFEESRAYPMSKSAGAVVDLLRFALDERHCNLYTGQAVRALRRQEGRFLLDCDAQISAGSVLVAAGGRAAPHLGSDGSGYSLLTSFGHRLIPPRPALVQVVTGREYVRQLKGVKVEAAVFACTGDTCLRRELGEVLFCDYGLSGPPILQISRLCSTGKGEIRIVLDLLPDMEEEVLRSLLSTRTAAFPGRPLAECFTGILQKRLGQVIVKSCGLSLTAPMETLMPANCAHLARAVKAFSLKALDTTGFDHAQVTAGGIDPSDFDANTLMSKKAPGLFAAGEILDVDGDCGGFNLAFAFACGIIAGRAAAGWEVCP